MLSLNLRSSLRALLLVASLGTLIGAQACGSSEVGGPAASIGGSTGSGGSPSAAMGGKATGGSAMGGKATGGTGGMAAVGVPASIQCGATTCAGYDIGMSLAPCCVNTTMCGVSIGGVCAPLGAPGTTSPKCAAQDASVFSSQIKPGTLAFAGCCTQQGTCGVVLDTTLFQGPNFGCIDPSARNPMLPVGVACGPGAGGAGGMGAGGGTTSGGAAATGGAMSGGAAGAATGGAAQAGNAGNGGAG